MKGTPRPKDVALDAARELARVGRPLGAFDPTRYFRADETVKFHGVATGTVRQLARTVDHLYGKEWGVRGAIEFAETLMPSEYLDEKGLGIELVARHARELEPKHIAVFKKWLRRGFSTNWATTDAICGLLIGPLAVRFPRLAGKVALWSADRNMWMRRASAVALIPSIRAGRQLDLAYRVAARLHADQNDLIQKAAGWMLREAGKPDARRLERYLRENGPRIPRTTVRYAIERFSDRKRSVLLRETKAPA